MTRQPHSRTKIIGGKLVTVYDKDPVQYPNVYSRLQNYQQSITSSLMGRSTNPLINARLEAQRNKARALQQTYRSVLSPEPLDSMDKNITSYEPLSYRSVRSPEDLDHVFRNTVAYEMPKAAAYEIPTVAAYELPRHSSHRHTYVPVSNLSAHILDTVASFSRYKLLTILSAMRRLDPHETGVLFKTDVEGVLDIHNVMFKDQNVFESLCSKYEESANEVDYRRMWKFVMDCYANKDKVDFSNDKQNYYKSPQFRHNATDYSPLSRQSYTEKSNKREYYDKTKELYVDISPGFKAELEFELRHYARSNQGCVDLNGLQDSLEMMDPFRTGKLLHKDVSVICKDHLSTLNVDILNASISACDVEKCGLVNYNLFLKLLRDSQPTYLPPIGGIPQELARRLQDDQESRASQFPNHNEISNQFQIYQDVNGRSDVNNNETFYSNLKLEEAGTLGLHLSEFETEIHSRKSAPSTPKKLERPSTYRKDKCDNVNTYTLLKQPPPPNATDKSNTCLPSEEIDRIISEMSMNTEENCAPVSNILSPSPNSTVVSPKSPRVPSSKVASSKLKVGKACRKQWHKTNESVLMDSNTDNPSSPPSEKWWKNECDSGNATPSDGHKTWAHSSHLETIKGKRRRKKKKVNKKEHAKNTVANDKYDSSGSNTEPDKTDMDSAFYTTTDYEVDDKNVMLSSKSASKFFSSYFSDDQESNEFNDSLVACGEKSEKSEHVSEAIINEQSHEEEEEKLHLECVTPPLESSSESVPLKINGKLFPVYPSVSIASKTSEAPNKKLCLEYIYGHGGRSIHCISSGELVFHVGNIVVVMDTVKLKQRFFKKHNAVVSCLAVHGDTVTAASAQKKAQKKCMVYVWNCIDLSVISTIFIESQDVLHISAMDFSKVSANSSLLATVQNYSTEQNISVYDWKNSSLKYKITTSNVSGLLFSNIEKSSLVTYGKLGHVMFYKIVDDTLVGSRGDFGDLPVAKNTGCAVMNKYGNLITGDTNGTIHIWENGLHRIDHCIHNAHKGQISSMVFDAQGYLLTSSGKDGTLISWDSQMKLCDSILLPEVYVGTRTMLVHKNSLFMASTSNVLVKAILNKDGNPLKGTKDNIVAFSEGNPDVTTGFAVHPSYKEMIVTLCADGTVQMFNADSKNVVWVMNVKGNGSCIVFHPCLEFIVIGCQDGSVHLVSSTTGDFVDKFKNSHVPVSSLQFSPDGKYLACGFHNGQLLIYTLDENSRELEYWFSDHMFHNEIVSIDWALTNTVLRVQSCNLELTYYNTSSKSCIENNKELTWSSNNCSISYETSGAWKIKDSFSGNTVFDISSASNFLVYVSRGLLCMVNYPWTKQEVPNTSTPIGFEGADSRLCCAVDGGKLFVAFDVGGCLWQWNIS